MTGTEPLAQHICKTCGHSFEGYFCNLCGERVLDERDRKTGSFLKTVLMATTISDNRFIKSLRHTIAHPGFLSREYVDGRRVPYMRPLQMFFILNVIYFLFPVLQLFNSSLYTQIHVLPHARLARNIVAHRIVADKVTMIGFELMYNEKTTRLAKLLVVLFVAVAALPLSLIFRRRNRLFSDHMALAIELSSFNIAVNAIGLSLLLMLVNMVFHWSKVGWGSYLNDLTLTIIFILTNLYFIFNAARTFYNQKGKRLVIKAFLGILGLFLALEVYRFLLFFITLWTL